MIINDLLQAAVAQGASDIHLSVGTPPVFRISGQLAHWLPDNQELTPLTKEDSQAAVRTIMSPEQFQYWEQKGECDFSYSLPGVGRFRVNVYRQRGCPSMAIRPVPYQIPLIKDLGLPQAAANLAEKSQGLVLITGSKGSGKSTTMAALINKINRERCCHIITLEDPIEYLHQHQRSIVNQREIGSDTLSLAGALKACLRQDPDVIQLGEMQDPETVTTALSAAETGNLVMASLRTNSAVQTIERLIGQFPGNQHEQIRVQLSSVLQGIVTQQLIPAAEGKGRVLAAEVLIVTGAVRNLIREGKLQQINTVIQTGSRWGMQTMEMALRDLVKAGQITKEAAQQYCNDTESLNRMLVNSQKM